MPGCSYHRSSTSLAASCCYGGDILRIALQFNSVLLRSCSAQETATRLCCLTVAWTEKVRSRINLHIRPICALHCLGKIEGMSHLMRVCDCIQLLNVQASMTSSEHESCTLVLIYLSEADLCNPLRMSTP